MLQLHNVEVVYHSVVLVLRGVTLEVPEGQIVALLGPNGAGKTTTIRAITGLLANQNGQVTKGEVRFRGESLLGQRADTIVGKGIAQAMEGRRIFSDLTVEEILIAGGYRADKAEIQRNLERFYQRFPVLGERRKQQAGYLSGGEQQMLAIARALMAGPKLLLLDEPSLGLAPKVVGEVANLIAELNRDGLSILLIEQNAAVALDLAHHAYVMDSGKVVRGGTAAELKADKDIQEFYLGIGNKGGERSFREAKLYQRRKRWLS